MITHFTTYRRIVAGLVLTSVLLPVTVFATALQSQNFELDGLLFATGIALDTGQNSVPPAITSEGPTVINLQPTQATIMWRTDKNSSSAVQYGTTATYGQESNLVDFVTEHTVTVYGLKPETLYHFSVISTDRFGAKGTSSDRTFTTPSELGINTIKISDVGYDRALVYWKTGDFTNSLLEYGQTLTYGQSKESASRSFTTEHTVQLTDLRSGSDYHLRIVARNERGDTVKSSDFTFTTLANPIFTKISVEPVTPNTVTVIWTTNTATIGILRVTPVDGQQDAVVVGEDVRVAEHRTVVRGLIGHAQYSLRITATDFQGKEVTSSDTVFSTPQDTTSPVISDLKVNVTRSGNDLVLTSSWKTDEPADSAGELQKKDSSEKAVSLDTQKAFGQEHVLARAGLSASTAYSLKVISKDPTGNRSEQTISFVTPSLKKSILELLLDSVLKSFGWINRALTN